MKKDTLSAKAVYLSYMDEMMDKMMMPAKAASPEGAFFEEMIPHHEGAIQMAKYEIAHGKDFEMRQLAKSIMAEQNSEIGLMKLWLKDNSKSPAKISPEFQKAMDKTMDVMMKSLEQDTLVRENDYAFAQVMIPHHQAAIDMARVILTYSKNEELITFARLLISNEQIEITQMSGFLK
ncbi:MAG: DUF305 domain-containing protein [Bacteroidota bacterium]